MQIFNGLSGIASSGKMYRTREECKCADCDVCQRCVANINRREEAQRLVGMPGTRCVFARALSLLGVLLHARERAMNPRLVTDQVARLLLLCLRSNVQERRNKAQFLSMWYQVEGAPLEGVHVLGLDYYYGPHMEVSSIDQSVTGMYGYIWVVKGIYGYVSGM